jgi:hypothetical protein
VADGESAPKVNPGLVAEIVRSYVANNSVAVAQLGELITTVHRSLSRLGEEAPTPFRWRRQYRSGAWYSQITSSASNAAFARKPFAGIYGCDTSLMFPPIARGGNCAPITR